MKHWMLFLLMVFGSAQGFSQQGYFIYLQTDNHQPFYVRLNNKVYSSTASGYLIIPQLADSSYQLIAGFPANAFPEQYFDVSLHRKDAGYLLKDFGEKGWGLFNLQSLAVIMNTNASREKKSPEVSVIKKDDAFSALLANAVNDTSILYASAGPVPAPEKPVLKATPAPDTSIVASAKDTGVIVAQAPPAVDTSVVARVEHLPDNNKKDTATAVPAPITEEKAVAPEKTVTLKVAELLTDTSYIAVYTDEGSQRIDTIRMSIPLDKPGVLIAEAPRKAPVYDLPGEPAARKDSVAAVTPEKTVPQKTVPDTTAQEKTTGVTEKPRQPEAAGKDSLPAPVHPGTDSSATIAPNTTVYTDTAKAAATVPPKSAIPNSDCKSLAFDSDIDKLRVKMLAAKTDEDKILVARKFFKQKCLFVKQVRALSELFLTDDGKYKWLDVSYPSVSDTGNFYQLGDLIRDAYYQNRFKAMLRH